MGKEPVHRPHKGNQCFKIDCPVIERKAQRHDLTDPNLLDSVWIGINARLFLQSSHCYGKNLRRHNLEQSCRAVLLSVNTPDIGHSCASLLLANGVPLKQIQEWLGHSDFSTTANIYAHLDYSSKLSSAQAMENGIFLPESGDSKSKWEEIKGK